MSGRYRTSVHVLLTGWIPIALLAACGAPGATPVPLATRLPTQTPPPGESAPFSASGEPGPAQSQTVDPASPEGARPQAGAWPDLLFANLYERPTNADGSYREDLDLIGAGLSVEGGWIYVTLRLGAASVPGSGAHYSVEFDTDLDGRPDMLVIGGPMTEPAWSTAAMRAYLDTDRNVGGIRPRLAEAPVAEWDGFETQREDAISAKPQALVWIRSSSGDTPGIQIAVARWMIGAPEACAWRAWAQGAGFNPGRREYNDFHSLEAAGSPYPTSASYPSKSLVAIDNTCVVSFGTVPTEALPGYCETRVDLRGAAGEPPDDLVYAPGGRGVIILLEGDAAGGAAQGTPASAGLIVPGGILPTPTP